ncbi:MAG: c-type cytochrome [Marivibrio sp.]|uniref:c-type cytochrome n=1 Tax=Marivibrio sp. TaxID=2039719 RepID=UPI0032EB2136
MAGDVAGRWMRAGALALAALVFTTAADDGPARSEQAGGYTREGSRPAVRLQEDLGDYDRGEYLAERLDCIKCHGPAGYGEKPGWPKLAGQYEQYLLNAIRNFRDGNRPHAFMSLYAEQLTERVIHDLALYYACQTENPGVGDEERCPQ